MTLPRIKALPAATSALIAAGEIIHSPKDVLKELLENALDAGATKISIELQKGGIDKIVVRDNGCGILAEDLQYAPMRYTTSKLQHVDELKELLTYGFRGEALFSISSVSNFTLRSRPQSQEYGHQIRLWSPYRQWEEQQCAMEVGSEVLCEHLFNPLPVRRQFLKSPRLEGRRCVQTVINILLIQPQCAVHCSDQGVTQLNWQPSEDLIARFSKALDLPSTGWETLEHACDRGTIKLWYYPVSSKGLEQYWYCHKRWFTDKNLSKIAQQFFEQGVLIIELELHRASVDVNFHPQKHEIDFIRKEGLIASLTDLFQSVRPLKKVTQQPRQDPPVTVVMKPIEPVISQKPERFLVPKESKKLEQRSLPLRPLMPPATEGFDKKEKAHWVFVSQERALHYSLARVILFNPQKLGAYICQQQVTQDLLLPVAVPDLLAQFLERWSCRIQHNKIEAIPRSWDRFWVTAIVADFREDNSWYRRFYDGLRMVVWEKLAAQEVFEKALNDSASLVKDISYEELCEKLEC